MRTLVLAVTTMMFVTMAVCAVAQVAAVPSPAGGRAIHLTGQDAAVAKDNNSLDHELRGNFTIEAWVNLEKLPEGDDQWTIVAKPGSYEWSIVGPKHKFAMGKAYSFAFRIEPGPGHKGIVYLMGDGIIKGDITLGWHHVAIMADIARFKWAFDGEVLSGGPFCAIPGSDSEFYVGGRPDRPGSFFKGSIDELRISRVKRYDENKFDRPEERFNPDEHAMGLWHFDESERIFFDSADANVLFLRRGGLAVDSSGKLATEWGAIKDERK